MWPPEDLFKTEILARVVYYVTTEPSEGSQPNENTRFFAALRMTPMNHDEFLFAVWLAFARARLKPVPPIYVGWEGGVGGE
jgi:hypothetical protein